jgi:hypothetical protein
MLFRVLFAGIVLAGLIPGRASAALTSYFQDFESLDRTDPSALANDGWLLFAAGINGAPGFGNFGAGPFAPPNNITAPSISVISDVASGGSPPAGNQGLVFFSDYGSPLHSDPADPRDLVLSLFQERTISATDIGSTVTFSWLADGNAAPPTGDALTEAFLLTLDPGAGFAATNNLAFDTTATADGALASNSLTLALSDPALVGQILQFGFRNTASDFEGSAVDYDNVSFTVTAIPEPSSVCMLAAIAVGGLVVSRRRSAERKQTTQS